ncbi:MAG: hypothetical protein R3322_09755 [Kiloniellales bacterium]|nr:hypothetical protein [Kiloniellales bacterium]
MSKRGGKWPGLMALSAVLLGCTQITVVGADGEVTTENGVGIVKLEAHPNRQPQIIRSTGFGIVSHDGRLTIGYHASDIALLPSDDCRIVVWLEEGQSLEAIQDIVAENDDICVIDNGRTNLTGSKP